MHHHHHMRRHLCSRCGDHKADWVRRSKWWARADHDLCMRCYRSRRDNVHAAQLSGRVRADRRRQADQHHLAA